MTFSEQEAPPDPGPVNGSADPPCDQLALDVEDGAAAATDPDPDGGAESADGADAPPDCEDAPPDCDDAEPDELARVTAELERLQDQRLRLAADFDNYRRRTEDRLRQRWDRAQAELVSRFLDPLDDLLRVTTLEPESQSSVEAIVEGVDLVERKFLKALEDAGVEVVDPGGEAFDPNTMEAMMRVPAESEDDDDTVAMVFRKGYAMRGVLIRPAQVSVFKHD